MHWSPATGSHLILNSHLWLSEAVACAAATPQTTALAGRQNLVRVADGYSTLGELGICSSLHAKTVLADRAKKIT